MKLLFKPNRQADTGKVVPVPRAKKADDSRLYAQLLVE